MTHEDALQLIAAIQSLTKCVTAIGWLVSSMCFFLGLGMVARTLNGAKGKE